MKEETIDKIIDVVIKWNCRKIEGNKAMFDIWDILQRDEDEELQKEWDRRNLEVIKNENSR